MPVITPVPPLPEVTIRLSELVPPLYRHYFNGRPDRPNYRVRRYDFGSSAKFLPLVRAYLNTCAAQRDADYQYLFCLLGTELAANALKHSRSGLPGRSYSLLCERHRAGLLLTCRDDGGLANRKLDVYEREYLTVDPSGLDPRAECGRGLAMIDALASKWGDNGRPNYRKVWFFLAYDMEDSLWPDLRA
ncbi:ATP-binding protein [Nocardiopsis sp. NPDC058631]|uniref:ATP-binding protein n=1 Tax=Nocardiopsis sp. NPDC058631 TaxID=3346566 RepID=UPI00366138AD